MVLNRGNRENVPAHAGGVDLSHTEAAKKAAAKGPRPCGRGGFKLINPNDQDAMNRPRPCGRGGFKHENRV